ncbi:MAG TPA: hypothetical protein VMV72_18765 [Verrucomicrobiae bacterium]|nr:hypothetical protein [Verrucomicrobiae bacterium]
MKSRILSLASLLAAIMTPTLCRACACGCGVFDVGTSSMFPEGAGGTAFVDYDYQDQYQNWHGSSKAPAANNDDKEIRTDFATLGFQYMFNRRWGVEAELPYDFRYFKGTDESGNVAARSWNGFGDMRLRAIYTGFSEDMSAGLTLGVKLPTGSYTRDSFLVDRDTQLGTGSTDLLLGGFFRHALTSDNSWGWFAQGEVDVATLTQQGYRPGNEFDGAAGVHYNKILFGRVRITPLAQVIGSWRSHDDGPAADPENTGYGRLLLSPAIEVDVHPIRFYGDAEFPVYQNFNGNQLAAPVMFKFIASYMF